MLARSAHCNFCLQHALSWFCKLSDHPGKVPGVKYILFTDLQRASPFAGKTDGVLNR
jgi:hypothetical protein